MKNAIILHGKPGKQEYYDPEYPSASNCHWIPWLQKQLLINEIVAYTPEVPHSYDPQYPIWKKEFERFEVTPETILVGHSCGGGFLVRWLSENKEARAEKVVLVAPWLDIERESTTDFFDFQIDPELSSRIGELIIFCSDDDNISIQESVKIIRNEINGIIYHGFHDYGHFTQNTMKKSEFPELLAVLLS
jgi:predicted alpha/beta hydrolase family esterase